MRTAAFFLIMSAVVVLSAPVAKRSDVDCSTLSDDEIFLDHPECLFEDNKKRDPEITVPLYSGRSDQPVGKDFEQAAPDTAILESGIPAKRDSDLEDLNFEDFTGPPSDDFSEDEAIQLLGNINKRQTVKGPSSPRPPPPPTPAPAES
jgi:hypothetical protein